LLHIGANDVFKYQPTDSTKTLNDFIVDMNNKLPLLVEEKSTVKSPLMLADQYTG